MRWRSCSRVTPRETGSPLPARPAAMLRTFWPNPGSPPAGAAVTPPRPLYHPYHPYHPMGREGRDGQLLRWLRQLASSRCGRALRNLNSRPNPAALRVFCLQGTAVGEICWVFGVEGTQEGGATARSRFKSRCRLSQSFVRTVKRCLRRCGIANPLITGRRGFVSAKHTHGLRSEPVAEMV